jgi:anti-sigma B factor antagonist
VTDGDGAASRPGTGGLLLAADNGPDECDALTVRVRRGPGHVLIAVAGEVDYASVAGLRVRLLRLAGTGHPLVADLDRVSFIDAAGLGALAGAARRAAAHGASLRVVCARPRIRRLFRVTGLDQVVPLAGTLDEALGMLASTAKAEAV